MELATTSLVNKYIIDNFYIGQKICIVDLVDKIPRPMSEISSALSLLLRNGYAEISEGRVVETDEGYSRLYQTYKLIKMPEYVERAKPNRHKLEKSKEEFRDALPAVKSAVHKIPRVFIVNYSYKHETDKLENFGKVVTLCPMPMFDDYFGPENIKVFEKKMSELLDDFDPDLDYVACYGDSILLAMAMFYLGSIFDEINMLRFSSKKQEYLTRRISLNNF